jgi:hypothetical protein
MGRRTKKQAAAQADASHTSESESGGVGVARYDDFLGYSTYETFTSQRHTESPTKNNTSSRSKSPTKQSSPRKSNSNNSSNGTSETSMNNSSPSRRRRGSRSQDSRSRSQDRGNSSRSKDSRSGNSNSNSNSKNSHGRNSRDIDAYVDDETATQMTRFDDGDADNASQLGLGADCDCNLWDQMMGVNVNTSGGGDRGDGDDDTATQVTMQSGVKEDNSNTSYMSSYSSSSNTLGAKDSFYLADAERFVNNISQMLDTTVNFAVKVGQSPMGACASDAVSTVINDPLCTSPHELAKYKRLAALAEGEDGDEHDLLLGEGEGSEGGVPMTASGNSVSISSVSQLVANQQRAAKKMSSSSASVDLDDIYGGAGDAIDVGKGGKNKNKNGGKTMQSQLQTQNNQDLPDSYLKILNRMEQERLDDAKEEEQIFGDQHKNTSAAAAAAAAPKLKKTLGLPPKSPRWGNSNTSTNNKKPTGSSEVDMIVGMKISSDDSGSTKGSGGISKMLTKMRFSNKGKSRGTSNKNTNTSSLSSHAHDASQDVDVDDDDEARDAAPTEGEEVGAAMTHVAEPDTLELSPCIEMSTIKPKGVGMRGLFKNKQVFVNVNTHSMGMDKDVDHHEQRSRSGGIELFARTQTHDDAPSEDDEDEEQQETQNANVSSTWFEKVTSPTGHLSNTSRGGGLDSVKESASALTSNEPSPSIEVSALDRTKSKLMTKSTSKSTIRISPIVRRSMGSGMKGLFKHKKVYLLGGDGVDDAQRSSSGIELYARTQAGISASPTGDLSVMSQKSSKNGTNGNGSGSTSMSVQSSSDSSSHSNRMMDRQASELAKILFQKPSTMSVAAPPPSTIAEEQIIVMKRRQSSSGLKCISPRRSSSRVTREQITIHQDSTSTAAE